METNQRHKERQIIKKNPIFIQRTKKNFKQYLSKEKRPKFYTEAFKMLQMKQSKKEIAYVLVSPLNLPTVSTTDNLIQRGRHKAGDPGS